jgi:hypothetical protein
MDTNDRDLLNPTNGMIIYNNDSHIVQAFCDTTWVNLNTEIMNVMIFNPSNGASTEFIATSTFIKIEVDVMEFTTTSLFTDEWNFTNDNTMEYIGNRTFNCMATYKCNVFNGNDFAEFAVSLYKNGNELPETTTTLQCNAGVSTLFTASSIVSLEANDVFELYISNNSNINSVDVREISLIFFK